MYNKEKGCGYMNINMDIRLLVSIINTKLRNDFETLEILCEDENLNHNDLLNRLYKDGYHYDLNLNQIKVGAGL